MAPGANAMQLARTLQNAGNDPYDLGFNDNLDLFVIANGSGDTVRLLDSTDGVRADVSVTGMPWIVAVAPEQ
ncbi:hypothetical protein D3C83_210560 [compost metagenome]